MSGIPAIIKGKDWDKQAILISNFHKEMQIKFGFTSGKRGRPKRFEYGWTLKQTAEALEISVGYVSESISLAKYLELYPELKYAGDRDKALNIIKDKNEDIILPQHTTMSNKEFLESVVDILKEYKQDKDTINRLKRLARDIGNIFPHI